MTFKLTRRQFGVGTLALAYLALARPGGAQSGGYANPELLMEPGDLIGAASPMKMGRPKYEAAGIVVVDVRPRSEFDAGHIPGARHLDPNQVVARHSPIDGALQSVPDLERILGALGIAADRRVVFYDDWGGFHAARMLWLMEYLGHANVAVLNGGWSAWQAANGPVTSIELPHEAAPFQAAISPRRHATAEDVLVHRDHPDGVLIDVRPPHMYAEGHIPWAVNVPWSQNLDETERFLGADALRAHFEAQGITPENDVVMHCQIGLASSHSYVALRLLGYPRLRVYHRSWAEWGNDAALPKSTS
ncbi:MAG: sulfurtransferase [Pseudomonadota bacterium]